MSQLRSNLTTALASVLCTVVAWSFLAGRTQAKTEDRLSAAEATLRVHADAIEAQRRETTQTLERMGELKSLLLQIQAEQRILHRGQLR